MKPLKELYLLRRPHLRVSFNATNKGNNFNNTPDNVKTQSHNTNSSAATEKKDGEKEHKGTTTFTRFKG